MTTTKMIGKKWFPFVMRKRIEGYSDLQEHCLDLVNQMEDRLASAPEFLVDDNDSHFRDDDVLVYSSGSGRYSMLQFQTMGDIPEISDFDRKRLSRTLHRFGEYDPKNDERAYTKWTSFATPKIKTFFETFESPICRSSITKMDPNATLRPHWDMGPEFSVRIQVPIVATDGMEMGFRINKKHPWKVYRFEEGYAYFCNTGYEHYARNDGDQTRYQVRLNVIGQSFLWDYNEIDADFEKLEWDQ